jgi:hypothetical protein
MSDRATTVPLDTGEPSGASTYPVTPGSCVMGCTAASGSGDKAATKRSNRSRKFTLALQTPAQGCSDFLAGELAFGECR